MLIQLPGSQILRGHYRGKMVIWLGSLKRFSLGTVDLFVKDYQPLTKLGQTWVT